MKQKHWVLFILFSIFFSNYLNSQNYIFKDSLKWYENQEVSLSNDNIYIVANFENGIFQNAGDIFPVYTHKFKINQDVEVESVSFRNFTIKANSINSSTFDLSKQEIFDDFKIKANIYKERTQPYLYVDILPVRKNANVIEFLESFEVEVVFSAHKQRSGSRSYASNSVLSNGKWYKFSVSRSGIAKISYDDLVKLGVNVSNLSSNNISVYGNGGAVLPEKNSDFRFDDLQECAIEVVDGGDGKFDENDYILFYAQGPIYWKYDAVKEFFKHVQNPFSNSAYYFINVDANVGTQKRVQIKNSLDENYTNSINYFTDYAFHERDMENLTKSGTQWLGERFDITTNYTFPFVFRGVDSSVPGKIFTRLGAFSYTASSFNLSVSGESANISIGHIPHYTYKIILKDDFRTFTPNSQNINVNITYNKTAATSIGHLDYIEINVRRFLKHNDSHIRFREPSIVGENNITKFELSELKSSSKVWDITDHINPQRVDVVRSGSNGYFIDSSNVMREYVMFDNSGFQPINPIGEIPNQNLHALPNTDMLIVSHQSFLSEANRLAEFNRQERNMDVHVVSVSQIYNEFGSGSPDVTAIRDFVKMFYDRYGANMPKNLLLFGDASYDYKNVLGYGHNFVPTYQNKNSDHDYYSWATDDYMGLLDDNEGADAVGSIDIGIGRFVVTTQEQARQMVDKTIRYQTKRILEPETASQHSNYADWRTVVSLVADDEDGNNYVIDSEKLAKYMKNTYPDYNIEKIYFDAYPQVSFSGGQRYPDVEKAINNRVQKGAVYVNYIGHGGETGWAHERVLRISDILQWNNKMNMPIFITATCEFSRYDDPELTSAGELVFLNPNGGGVALFTTSRVAFAHTNFNLNKEIIENSFEKINGEFKSLGELMQQSKNVNASSYTLIRNFLLIGDPSIIPTYPRFKVQTTHINGKAISEVPDTIGAYSKVTVKGTLNDDDGNIMSDFNGFIYPSVYDKPSLIKTLANDPGSYVYEFEYQKNVLFKGKASVKNGLFEFTFIVPKDISYQFGNGKISYYAHSDFTDALGSYTNVIIGGLDTNSLIDDNEGPILKLTMNDDSFVDGGLTNENPVLIIYASDSSGINTVSNGIGHDAVIILNDDVANSIEINDFFQADLDKYNSGTFKYPFRKLPEGKHKVTAKVWDIMNNSSQESMEFVVVKSAELALKHVLNYPNPFTTHTQFYFEQNQAESVLQVQIQIFTISGKLVKTIHEMVNMSGFRSDGIPWDGTDDFGDKLAKGIYLYKIRVKDSDGKYAEKIEKVVII